MKTARCWSVPECAHEWSASDSAAATGDQDKVIKDAVGNTLQDGDTVTVIKDLKVRARRWWSRSGPR